MADDIVAKQGGGGGSDSRCGSGSGSGSKGALAVFTSGGDAPGMNAVVRSWKSLCKSMQKGEISAEVALPLSQPGRRSGLHRQ